MVDEPVVAAARRCRETDGRGATRPLTSRSDQASSAPEKWSALAYIVHWINQLTHHQVKQCYDVKHEIVNRIRYDFRHTRPAPYGHSPDEDKLPRYSETAEHQNRLPARISAYVLDDGATIGIRWIGFRTTSDFSRTVPMKRPDR